MGRISAPDTVRLMRVPARSRESRLCSPQSTGVWEQRRRESNHRIRDGKAHVVLSSAQHSVQLPGTSSVTAAW